mmetsp:Transcript_99436/g.197030  ORF Transcript_99436/g.197030 Transcript_99436/m.197030 type:complete len:203 (+) Transcript_99436:91-699(+)
MSMGPPRTMMGAGSVASVQSMQQAYPPSTMGASMPNMGGPPKTIGMGVGGTMNFSQSGPPATYASQPAMPPGSFPGGSGVPPMPAGTSNFQSSFGGCGGYGGGSRIPGSMQAPSYAMGHIPASMPAMGGGPPLGMEGQYVPNVSRPQMAGVANPPVVDNNIQYGPSYKMNYQKRSTADKTAVKYTGFLPLEGVYEEDTCRVG